jgi:FkbM family methyltransferase
MYVNPCECIGGNLFFSPQLYDWQERSWLRAYLREGDVFVDVGANIGSYTLWAHTLVGDSGRTYAIEADPENFAILTRNVALNNAESTIVAINVGVSDASGDLPFYRNARGNDGGNSFVLQDGNAFHQMLPVLSLYDVLRALKPTRVDFLKIDIEGFELRVLSRFFDDCKRSDIDFRPKYLLVELDEGPMRHDARYRSQLLQIISDNGYGPEQSGKNTLFALAHN